MAVTTTDHTVDEVLGVCRDAVEPALRAAVDALPDAVARIVGYHRGWLDEDGTPSDRPGGKSIRPALALLCGTVVAGRPDAAVPAAVAVELVHDFSLLHDDVMDGDLTRRHRPTAWMVFGTGPAILAGDALLARAMDVLAADPAAVRMLAAAVRDLVDGQVADLAFEQRTDVGPQECLTMAEAKTGALLGAACSLGALLAGGRPEQVRALERFGREVGVAFQLVDDLLGIWGAPEVTGKPVRNDLRSRKKSLPVVAALASGTSAGLTLREIYHRERELSEAELAVAADLVDRAGGRQWCRDRADGLLASAVAHLPDDPAAADACARLRLLAERMTRRDH